MPKPKKSHFVQWPLSVAGIVCRFKDKRGNDFDAWEASGRGRG